MKSFVIFLLTMVFITVVMAADPNNPCNLTVNPNQTITTRSADDASAASEASHFNKKWLVTYTTNGTDKTCPTLKYTDTNGVKSYNYDYVNTTSKAMVQQTGLVQSIFTFGNATIYNTSTALIYVVDLSATYALEVVCSAVPPTSGTATKTAAVDSKTTTDSQTTQYQATYRIISTTNTVSKADETKVRKILKGYGVPEKEINNLFSQKVTCPAAK